MGLKDDILVLSARNKFLVQFLVCLLMTLSSDVAIKSFFGLFGIYEINIVASLILTVFVYILIINSINLIDGIDGLAGIVACCFLFVSSFFFHLTSASHLVIISLTLLGSLIAFLKYNFSVKNKIFMGDTGSMIVGFIISYLVFNLLSLPYIKIGFITASISPLVPIAMLFYPLLDTLRVFFLRIFILKRSPFIADNNHIHHNLLKLGFSHLQITIFVGSMTLLLTLFSISLLNESIYFQIVAIASAGLLLFTFPAGFARYKRIGHVFFKGRVLILIACITLSFFQSCAVKSDILYLNKEKSSSFEDTRIVDQKIQPNDILSIKIYSLNSDSSKLFNIDLLEGGTAVNGLELVKLRSYLVNDEGLIVMPVFGDLLVSSKSTVELELYLKKRLIDGGYLSDPIVTVRILNAKITVLGEVRSPGTYNFLEKNLTVFQALGMAGDLTINGERKNILLIRHEGDKKTVHNIDLTTRKWMDTDLYYIKQNDVIVVNPNKAKVTSSGLIGNTGTFISLISLLLTSFLLIKK
ncbi:MAG: polysaccharide biosynthesis/export family protein [Flavobacteriaceae bacterium]|nr:polysaccharide biosynthesis/export family protein [Flavobacteriaceae bacterium]